jgi:hypothetical protein
VIRKNTLGPHGPGNQNILLLQIVKNRARARSLYPSGWPGGPASGWEALNIGPEHFLGTLAWVQYGRGQMDLFTLLSGRSTLQDAPSADAEGAFF